MPTVKNMPSKTDFPQWLQEQMDSRGWEQSDLARKAGINRQVIWSYLNRKRGKPDEDILKKIAQAFEIPTEQIYRIAGILPPAKEKEELIELILHELDTLPPEDREEVVEYIKFKARKKKSNHKKS